MMETIKLRANAQKVLPQMQGQFWRRILLCAAIFGKTRTSVPTEYIHSIQLSALV